MSETASTDTEVRGDPAFEVVEVDKTTGGTTVFIKRGLLGSLSNQLKATDDRRAGAGILRKLGHVLSECGDIQYGSKDVDDTTIDPNIVTED